MAEDPYTAALAEARKGAAEGGIPIGAVLVKDGAIAGRGHNRRVQRGDPTAHAEIECLRDAGRIGPLTDSTLYTTLTPCHLCAGAILLFGIPRVIVGETRTYDGEGSMQLLADHGVEVEVLDDASAHKLMADFIQTTPAVWDEDIGG